MYLQDRREKIYPTDNLCEKNCVLIDFNNDTNKIICKCPIKTSTDDYDKEDSFLSRNIDDAFDEKYLLPNIRVLKCFKIAFKVVHKNFLFYLTFCLLIGFIVAFFLGGGYKPFSDDPFDEFNEIIDELIEKDDDDNNDDRSSNNDNNNKSFNNKTNDEHNNEEDLISSQNTEQKDDEKRKKRKIKNKITIYNDEKKDEKLILGVNKKEKHLISETESNGSSNNKKVKSKGKDKEDKSTIVNVKGDNYDKDSLMSKIEPIEIKVEGEGQNNKVIFD